MSINPPWLPCATEEEEESIPGVVFPLLNKLLEEFRLPNPWCVDDPKLPLLHELLPAPLRLKVLLPASLRLKELLPASLLLNKLHWLLKCRFAKRNDSSASSGLVSAVAGRMPRRLFGRAPWTVPLPDSHWAIIMAAAPRYNPESGVGE